MKTVTSEQVRSDLTEIANEVKYTKESYILTKHNKPYVGIVPIEILKALALVLKVSAQNKKLEKLFEDNNFSFMSAEDIEFLDSWEKNPKEMSASLKKAAVSAKRKIENI